MGTGWQILCPAIQGTEAGDDDGGGDGDDDGEER